MRVLISAKHHSWYGETGEMTGEVLPTGQYVVELDNGMKAGVYKYEVTQL